MHVGAQLYTTEYTIRPDTFAIACEERGLESVWYPEHTHIPVGRRTPFPRGGELPEEYKHFSDPFICLTAAAAVTSRIKIGTGVCLVTEHDPIVLAKETATLDWISKGRFLFGVGAGWNADEMDNHGTRYAERWRVLEERVLAIKRIWTEVTPEYHGKYVNFDRMWSYPKPVQKPHPPVIMGAATQYGRERVARFCEGWIPIGFQIEDLAAEIQDLGNRLLKHGRKLADIEISLFWAPEDLDELKRLRDLGVNRAIMECPVQSESATLKHLDRFAELNLQLGNRPVARD